MRFGKLGRARDGRYTLTYERSYPHPPEKVWRALTEPEHLAGWFPSRIDGERRAGAKLRFAFEGDALVMDGQMRIHDPPRLLEYSWGEDLLRFELTPEGDGTKVVFVTTFADRTTAPRDGAGWHGCLENLGRVLGGGPPASFPDLYRQYLAEMGLGEFPRFLAGTAVADAWSAPGLDGQAFGDLLLVRAGRDTEIPEQKAPEAYVLVVEGRFTLRMGGQELPLVAGQEMTLPEGVPISARLTEGTRLVLGARRAGKPA